MDAGSSTLLGRDLATMRIEAGIVEFLDEFLPKLAIEVVFDDLRRIVQVIFWQREVFGQVAFPETMGADQRFRAEPPRFRQLPAGFAATEIASACQAANGPVDV